MCVLLGTGPLVAGVGTWKNFTSMKDVKGIARSGHSYWAATSGGLFRWDEGTDSYLKLTNAEGLQSTDLTAVGIDAHGNVWGCSSTGIIHIYTPSSGALQVVRNIVEFPGPTDKKINAVIAAGDTVLLCTDFGLSVYRIGKGEFGDTFTSFGSLPPNNRVAVYSALISGGQFWAALSDGGTGNYVARADISRGNLLDPQAWTLLPAGPAGSVPHALASFRGRLYAGTTTGLYTWNGTAWQSVSALAGASIVALDGSGTALDACTATGLVYTVDTSGTATAYGTPLAFTPTSVVAGSNGLPSVGTLSGGIQTFDHPANVPPAWTSHFPNGPNANQFNDLCIAPNGTLWCAGGGFYGTGTGFGFYRYNGSNWKSFLPTNSLLPDDEVYLVSTGCDGSVWASLYGFGIVQMPAGTDAIDSAHIFRRNAGLVGLSVNPDFIVPGNVVCDAHGNLWTTIVAPGDGNVLVVRTPAGSWRHVPVFVEGQRVGTLQDRPVNRCLAVDASDNLWACVKDPASAAA